MRVLFVALACVVVPGCTFGTAPHACDVCSTSAIVYGTVRSTSELPMAGVRISVQARRFSCRGSDINMFGEPVSSDASGNYRLTVISLFAPTAVCLIVAGQPPVSSGLTMAADTGHVIRLQPDYSADQPHDSVRVDLLVPASR